jgi:hypothetical protein
MSEAGDAALTTDFSHTFENPPVGILEFGATLFVMVAKMQDVPKGIAGASGSHQITHDPSASWVYPLVAQFLGNAEIPS